MPQSSPRTKLTGFDLLNQPLLNDGQPSFSHYSHYIENGVQFAPVGL
jgi:hypothetical protein